MKKSIRDGFGEALLALGKKHPEVVVVSADLASSMRVQEFARRFPKRFIEVGVAEQNAASIAAGLALSGKIVFLVSFACFSPSLNWGQIRQSICMNNANVKIVGGHGGLATGADGATHQALEDIALMRALPKMKVFVPIDYYQVKKMVSFLGEDKGPAYLRLVRPKTTVVGSRPFVFGKPEILKRGNRLTLIGTGPLLAETMEKFSSYLGGVEVINCPVLKPCQPEIIVRSLAKTKRAVVIEDHQEVGGLGSLIAEIMAEKGLKGKLVRIGMRDSFGESARDFYQLWEKYYWQRLEKEIKR